MSRMTPPPNTIKEYFTLILLGLREVEGEWSVVWASSPDLPQGVPMALWSLCLSTPQLNHNHLYLS